MIGWRVLATCTALLGVSCALIFGYEEAIPAPVAPGGAGGTATTQLASSAGGSDVSTASSSMMATGAGGGSCTMEPTFGACLDCFCEQDSLGCDAWTAVLVTHIYCGMTCGLACSQECLDPDAIDPSGALFNPMGSCELCVANITCELPREMADCDGYLVACQSDPECIAFIETVQGCPM